DADLRRPDLERIVLDPSGLRKNLAEFLLRHAADRAVFVEHDRARARRALVQGEDERHGRRLYNVAQVALRAKAQWRRRHPALCRNPRPLWMRSLKHVGGEARSTLTAQPPSTVEASVGSRRRSFHVQESAARASC